MAIIIQAADCCNRLLKLVRHWSIQGDASRGGVQLKKLKRDEILSVHVIEHFWRWEVVGVLKNE